MNTPQNVRDAGEAALRELRHRNGGALPLSLSDCKWLSKDMGIPMREDDGDGALLYFDLNGDPAIIYNPRATPWVQSCGIIHELAEYVLRAEYPLLTDYMYPVSYFFDGRMAPKDFRHMAASWTEHLYREWLGTQS